jgi:hypothetical protein
MRAWRAVSTASLVTEVSSLISYGPMEPSLVDVDVQVLQQLHGVGGCQLPDTCGWRPRLRMALDDELPFVG